MLASGRLQAETCLLAPFAALCHSPLQDRNRLARAACGGTIPYSSKQTSPLDMVTHLLRRPDKGDPDHD